MDIITWWREHIHVLLLYINTLESASDPLVVIIPKFTDYSNLLRFQFGIIIVWWVFFQKKKRKEGPPYYSIFYVLNYKL